MGGAASPSIVPRCTLWKVRCKLFLVKPARPALSTAVPRYLLVQAVSLLGNVTIFWNLSRNPEKISSKIRRKNAKFEFFAIELVNIH